MLLPILLSTVGLFSVDQGITYSAASRQKTAGSVLTTGLVIACGLSLIAMIFGYFGLPYLVGDLEGDVLENARFYLLFVPLNFIGLVVMGTSSGALQFGSWSVQRSLV